MYCKQVSKFFVGKDNAECALTDELIESGYMQRYGGYIKYARSCGINNPTQYWHLISSWCDRSPEDRSFNKRIQCGELIFWMAEVSQAVDTDTLTELKNTIINDYLYNRRKGNRKIQEVCFDNIVRLVEQYDKEH